MAALSQLLSDDAQPTRLRAAIACPASAIRPVPCFATASRVSLTASAAAAADAGAVGALFGIARIDTESAGVRSFVLSPKPGERLADYRAGQFLSVRFTGPDGRKQTRTWSLSDYAEGGPSYRISVLRVGSGSAHWHERMRVGDTVEIRSPQGSFALDRATPFRVVLISAGIGVTPLLSMLKAHALRPDPPPLLDPFGARRRGARVALGRRAGTRLQRTVSLAYCVHGAAARGPPRCRLSSRGCDSRRGSSGDSWDPRTSADLSAGKSRSRAMRVHFIYVVPGPSRRWCTRR